MMHKHKREINHHVQYLQKTSFKHIQKTDGTLEAAK